MPFSRICAINNNNSHHLYRSIFPCTFLSALHISFIYHNLSVMIENMTIPILHMREFETREIKKHAQDQTPIK